MQENEIIDNIKKEVERIKEDSIYSSKGHFESSKFWRYFNYILMIVSIASLVLCLVLTLIISINAHGFDEGFIWSLKANFNEFSI